MYQRPVKYIQSVLIGWMCLRIKLKMKLLFIILAATSTFATAKDCVDRSSFCFIYKLFCPYSWYREWLKQNCGGTCPNLCPTKRSCGIPQADFNTGSSIAIRGSSPWQAVITLNGRPLCSGSVISSKWILTAAHCVDGLESFLFAFKVRVGEYNLGIQEGSEVDLDVDQIIIHPLYNASTRDNDVSLIKLRSQLELSQSILPICLPKPDAAISMGSHCYITGWGSFQGTIDNEPRLRYAKILISPKRMCGEPNSTVKKITDRMICLKASKTIGCQGDSGGPFVCQDGPSKPLYLHGVISWGSRRCTDDPDSFIVFSKVAEFKQWINRITEN